MKELGKQILSDIVIFSKYAKYLPDKHRRETWDEIATRNKNMHIKKYPRLTEEIKEAYKLVYDKKVLPSGRALQFSGKPIEINPARQYNCVACAIDHPDVFAEIMFLMLSGCGTGISVQKHHIEKLPPIRGTLKRTRRFLVADNIEGWADAVKVLMYSYFFNKSEPIYDFSDIRAKGAPLVTSGGKAPGAQPLKDCLHDMRKVLDTVAPGEQLSPFQAHELVCYIGDAVLSGGVRRSSIISLFSYDDNEMLTCKSNAWWEKKPHLARANNTAVLLRHRIKKAEFGKLWNKISQFKSGEPAFCFSNNPEYLLNPCAEASLRSPGFCNLTTINFSAVNTQEEFEVAARVAAFIGTLQASYTDFHYLRDVWIRSAEKDALLGIGITGLARDTLYDFDVVKAAEVAEAENKRVAALLDIKPAARLTLIKPEGTSSSILGTSSGIHAWHSKYYIRRIRLNKEEVVYKYLLNRVPKLIEDDIEKPHIGAILSIPVRAPDDAILREDETALAFLERVKFVYRNWIIPGHRKGDNTHSVSATVTMRDDEWEQVGDWLWRNREFYNNLSFLPANEKIYPQMPFESITQERYEELQKYLKEIDTSEILEENDATTLQQEGACQGGACEIKSL